MAKNKNPKNNIILTGKENPKYPNDINKEFGYLRVLWEIELEYEYPIYYLCECKCGNTVPKNRDNLYGNSKSFPGRTQSCGCFAKEMNKTHGFSRGKSGKQNRLYKIWALMKNRCNNENDPAYHNYGGRGIKVCKKWGEYITFHKWAMKNGYDKKLTIERINNDKSYSPDNCKWITRKEQSKNRRSNSYFIINGERIIQKDLAERMGLCEETIHKMAIDGRLKYDYWNRKSK